MTLKTWIDPTDENNITVSGGSPGAAYQEIENKAYPGDVPATLLLNFNGVDGDAVYTSDDAARRTVTFEGEAQLDSAQKVFGRTSLFTSTKSPHSVVTVPASTDFDLGTGDFTIECWVRWDTVMASYTSFMSMYNSGISPNQQGWIFNMNTSGANLEFNSSSDGLGGGSTTASTSSVGSPLLQPDRWYHVACSRESGTVRIFLDGVQIGADHSHSADIFYTTTDEPLRVGEGAGLTGPGNQFAGWIDGSRLIVGTAIYTDDFQVPTRELSDGVGAKRSAALLVNFDGADGATSYTSEDYAARTATFVDQAQLDDAEKRFGTTSLRLVGTTTDHLTFPSSEDWQFGRDDYTVEGWFRFDGKPTADMFITAVWRATGDNRTWALQYNDTSEVLAWNWDKDGDGVTDKGQINFPFTPSGEQWYHFAACRGNGRIQVYLNGELRASKRHPNSGSPDIFYYPAVTVMDFGAVDGGAAQVFDGWFDGWRIIKGRALYTYPAPPAFRALLNGTDGAAGSPEYTVETGQVATFFGDAEIDTAQTISGNGSLRVSGTGYLEVPNQAEWQLIGDFTIECWVRFDGASSPFDKNSAFVANYDSQSGNNRGWFFNWQGASGLVSPLSLRFVYSATGSNYTDVFGEWEPTPDTWHHLAVSREGDVIRLFADGVQVGVDHTGGSPTADSDTFDTPSGLTIGAVRGASGYTYFTDGWIEGVQVYNGFAKYIEDFIPELPEPIVSSSFELIAKFDGTNGQTTYTTDDHHQRTVTFYGDAQLSTAQTVWDNTTSLRVGGAASPKSYVEIAHCDELNIGFDDFTIEGWFRFDATSPPSGSLFGKWITASPNGFSYLLEFTGASSIQFAVSINGTTPSDVIINTWTPVADTWYHVAVCRVGANIKMFIDGTQLGSDYSVGTDSFYTTKRPLAIGGREDGVSDWAGYVSDFRIVRGKSLYTENFTPRRMTQVQYRTPTQAYGDGAAVSINPVSSLRAMDFNAALPMVEVGGPLVDSDFSVGFVYTDDGTATPGEGLMGMSDSYQLDTSGWRIRKKNTTVEVSVGDATPLPIASGNTGDEMQVVVVTYSEATTQLAAYVDGDLVGVSQVTLGSPGIIDKDFLLGGSEGLLPWASGTVGDVVLVDHELRTDDRQRLEGYLAHKWKVAQFLPTAHPFRYRGPEKVTDSVLVANFDGDDGDTTYTTDDASARTVTFVGTAALSDNTRAVGERTALHLDGNSDYVTIPDSDDWAFGVEDFTVELWAYWDTLESPLSSALISSYSTTGDQRGWILWLYLGKLRFSFSVDGGLTASAPIVDWEPTAQTWYHIAVVRRGNSVFFYIDGEQVSDIKSTEGSLHNSTKDLWIGAADFGSTVHYHNGRISNVRITKGRCLYNYPFTPPARKFRLPVTATLIANFNGPDAATTYTSEDSFARAGSMFGGAQLDTAQKKFGVSSFRSFRDSPCSYIDFPQNSPANEFTFGTGDFTIEYWVRFATTPSTEQQFLVSGWDAFPSPAERAWLTAYWNTDFRFTYSENGVDATNVLTPWTPASATWYHIVVQRKADVLGIFIDGVLQYSDSAFTYDIFGSANGLEVGSLSQQSGRVNTDDLDGWVDGLRVIKGSAVYGFVEAPEELFDNRQDDSTVLINFEQDPILSPASYTTDDTTARALTFYGASVLTTAEKRVGTTCFYNSGITDGVGIPETSPESLALGAGDWTIDFWVRPIDLTSTLRFFFEQRISGSTQVRPTLYYNSSNIRFFVNGGDRIVGGAMVQDQWQHVALCKSNGTTTMYIDGVVKGSFADSFTYLAGTVGLMSQNPCGWASGGLRGYMDMFRWNVGTALYNGPFTPPSHPPGEPIV